MKLHSPGRGDRRTINIMLSYLLFSLCSAGCRIVVHLASGVCPFMGEAGLEACKGFRLGGNGTCPLMDGAGSCSSCGQGHVKGCLEVSLG